MKSVLISTQPKWVEKIASGEKTIEVRKTKPKIDTPFKCYIYCTKAKEDKYILERLEDGVFTRADDKVIGEFICDRITPLYGVATINWKLLYGSTHKFGKELVKKACLTEEECHRYAKGKHLFAWHISNLKIYDKPKELFDFVNYNKYQICKEKNCFSDDCWVCPNNAIMIRPPQSYCYVEEL